MDQTQAIQNYAELYFLSTTRTLTSKQQIAIGLNRSLTTPNPSLSLALVPSAQKTGVLYSWTTGHRNLRNSHTCGTNLRRNRSRKLFVSKLPLYGLAASTNVCKLLFTLENSTRPNEEPIQPTSIVRPRRSPKMGTLSLGYSPFRAKLRLQHLSNG